ncbi:MAG: MotA/TolQ/ExbB proton channel family protein [Rhodobacteraceae bacterium]|jgi:biopolymer transport protein ExbB|nr:MotA/TolQ/ExbB proton channel family protein [Paracoccaceae bacterium]
MEQPVTLLDALLPEGLAAFLDRGGPAMWAIALLSVVGLALILWKLWDFLRLGAFGGGAAEAAVAELAAGRAAAAAAALSGRRGARARLAAAALAARSRLPEAAAREETARQARRILAEARAGLRGLDLIVTVAPLLGLLGTVLGMIGAFQALQATGTRADPAVLAGGIWEALLTTAAGMGVAIPAAAALAWAEGVVDGLRTDLEDIATRIFLAPAGGR